MRPVISTYWLSHEWHALVIASTFNLEAESANQYLD